MAHIRMVAKAKRLVHWFLGGKGLGIQQGMSVWVGSPKSQEGCFSTWTLLAVFIPY